MLEVHDIDSDEMLTCLRLRVGLISCNEQEGGIHDSRTSQHGRHEGIVTWTVDKRDMPRQHKWRVAMFAVHSIGLGRVERCEAVGGWALNALVKLGVGITQLNCNVSQFLSEETYSLKPLKRRVS